MNRPIYVGAGAFALLFAAAALLTAIGLRDATIKKQRETIQLLKIGEEIDRDSYKALAKRFTRAERDYAHLAQEAENRQDTIDELRKNQEALTKQLRGSRRDATSVSRGGRRTGGRSLEEIKMAESGGNYGAKNRSSGAGGAYQFLPSTWQRVTGLPGSAEQYPPAVQDEAARKLYSQAGDAPWRSSR